MAQKDYINTKRPTKGKKQPAKKAKKPFPLISVLIITVLVGAFGYGLWYIKTNADPEAVKQTKQQKKVEKPVIKKPKTPEFINEIKQHEVKVQVKEIEQKGPYVMQCGSFKTYGQAETLKAKIAFAGLVAEIKRTEGKNGVWFKVRLGPYSTKRGAESDKNKLKRQKITGCGIWNWT